MVTSLAKCDDVFLLVVHSLGATRSLYHGTNRRLQAHNHARKAVDDVMIATRRAWHGCVGGQRIAGSSIPLMSNLFSCGTGCIRADKSLRPFRRTNFINREIEKDASKYLI